MADRPDAGSEPPLEMGDIETPYRIYQVETHLFFGPISRHIDFFYIGAAVLFLGGFANIFLNSKMGIGQRIGGLLNCLVVFYLLSRVSKLRRMTRRQQAILGWMGTKLILAIACLCFMMGGLVGLRWHQTDALPNLLLGLVWVPSIEFIPRVTPHQKYVTLVRLVLSVPLVYFGIRSGNWSW